MGCTHAGRRECLALWPKARIHARHLERFWSTSDQPTSDPPGFVYDNKGDMARDPRPQKAPYLQPEKLSSSLSRTLATVYSVSSARSFAYTVALTNTSARKLTSELILKDETEKRGKVKILLSHVRSLISFRGASGDVSFNDAGDRVNYTINIYSGKDKFAQNLAGFFTQDIKSWQEANGETWPGKPGKRTYIQPFRQSDARVIKVLAVPEPPFFMQKGWEQVRYRKENIKYDNADRNDEPYEGYAWELIKDVKKVFEEEMGIDFNFEITLMSRGQYGSLDLSTGEWDGMIRELIDGDADVAIGSLTKVGAREDAIDFTGTWYKSQLKVAILHPSWTFEYPFSLVFPLHVTAWAALVALFVIISSMVFFLGYFSPYEYRRLAERGEATEEEAGTFSIGESIFYCLSTGFWQSFHRSPKSWSLRLLSMFWFWFCICTIFLYAWNVNSVFKFSKTAIKIKDVHDLLFNDIHEFGAVRNSPSYDFYRFNKGQYRMVFDRILNSDRNLLEDRIEEAIYRVRRQWDGRYAVLGEERILSYAADRKPCRLFISGKTLGKISFSFATPSGSPLRDQLSYALKVLKKRGNITRILDMKFSNSLKCARDTLWETETKKSFTVHDLQGMYYLIFCGMGGSVIVMILEWLLYVLAIDKGARPTFVGRRGDQGGHRAPPQNKMTTDFYGQDPKDAAPDKGATDWI
ncbi:putative glutamate receptor 1 [Apostichopus japonicus]|uniref:Putative glutamate receptor 1 n=1 Tax=Stichopus japonicus TaxID=307972 RepID=A0A2G8JV56_STIJA|nr:putative glutamate receptor 1 [Apostichopus japonicus]